MKNLFKRDENLLEVVFTPEEIEDLDIADQMELSYNIVLAESLCRIRGLYKEELRGRIQEIKADSGIYPELTYNRDIVLAIKNNLKVIKLEKTALRTVRKSLLEYNSTNDLEKLEKCFTLYNCVVELDENRKKYIKCKNDEIECKSKGINYISPISALDETGELRENVDNNLKRLTNKNNSYL